MALGVWQANIVDDAGNIKPDAEVEVKLESSGALAAIWQDLAGTIPLTNPAPVGVDGFLRFYVLDNDFYRVRAFEGAFERLWEDVLIPAAQVTAFTEEMKKAGADFRVVSYPGVKHSFTNPEADTFARKFNLPLAYSFLADQDSWGQTLRFFTEIFK